MKNHGEFVSASEAETKRFAEKVAKTLVSGDVVALFGEMGVGKTAFTRGLANALECPYDVSSPTFSIVNNYGQTNLKNAPKLIHFDMYRVKNWDDLETSGFFEYIDAGEVLVVEWSENIESALPENSLKIHITRITDNERIIKWERKL